MSVARRMAIRVGTMLATISALAQTPQGPTPTPSPATPGTHTRVRVVVPSGGSDPNPSQAVPLNPVEVVSVQKTAGAREETKNELVIAPIPLSNPAIGSGLGLAAVYTLTRKQAEETPPTTMGAGGFYTSTGSWAGAAAIKLYLKEDRYRVTLAGGLGALNYDLFALGPNEAGIPVQQKFTGALGELMVGLGKRWYAGLRAGYGATQVALQHGEEGGIPVPPEQLDVTVVALGLKGERDSRDSVFYPTDGAHLVFLANHNDNAFGSDFTYTKTDVTFTEYFTLGGPVVLALEGAGCYASDGAPFFDLCLFGANNVLRGYTVGRYLDRSTVAAQGEVRWRFANRWVTTAFLGVGSVKPEYSPSTEAELLPAGGIGVQWIAAPQNMITVRVDYAWGKDRSHALYVSIGQAF